jgi:hypothetical protein
MPGMRYPNFIGTSRYKMELEITYLLPSFGSVIKIIICKININELCCEVVSFLLRGFQ